MPQAISSETGVPRNLPYGERQNTVAAMQQADVPLSPTRPTTTPAARPPAGGSGVRQPLDLLAETTPADFPFIGEEQPLPAEQSGSVLDSLAVSAQSSFAQAVLSRLNR